MKRDYIDKTLEDNAYNSGIVDDLFDEVFIFFNDHTVCKNCEHWYTVGKSKSNGKCSVHVQENIGLTQKNFGCNKWKEKQ